MKTTTISYGVCLFVLSFLFLLFMSNGCSKDSSSSTPSSEPTPHSAYPSVAKDWTGRCNGDNYYCTLAAAFRQFADSTLNATIDFKLDSLFTPGILWEMSGEFGGKITTGGQISLVGTQYTVISGPSMNTWGLQNISATLSTGADTISGTFLYVAGHEAGRGGNLKLVKK